MWARGTPVTLSNCPSAMLLRLRQGLLECCLPGPIFHTSEASTAAKYRSRHEFKELDPRGNYWAVAYRHRAVVQFLTWITHNGNS